MRILPGYLSEATSLKLQTGSVNIKNMGTLQFQGEDSSDHGSISCTKTGNNRTLTVNSDVSTLLGTVEIPEALRVTAQGGAQTTLDNLTVGYDTTLADVNVGGTLSLGVIKADGLNDTLALVTPGVLDTDPDVEIVSLQRDNVTFNKRFLFPMDECIFTTNEYNKHFQLNLIPANESPNDTSNSYGSGISFWSTFTDADPAPRLFANINCRNTSGNWSGGQLEFRVRKNQQSGYEGGPGAGGDLAALTTKQMTITGTNVNTHVPFNVINPNTGISACDSNGTAKISMRYRDNVTNPVRTFSEIDSTDDLDIKTTGGNLTFETKTNGAVTFTDGTTTYMAMDQTDISIGRNLLPGAHNTYDIGQDTLPTGAGDEQWFQNIFCANLYVNNVAITSDVTLKKDIVDLEYGLDYIKNLRPKQYKYKSNVNGREHWGFLAQDVRELNGTDKLSVWGKRPSGKEQLNYTEFIAVIVKAIQEATSTTENLIELVQIQGERITQLEQLLLSK